MILPVAAVLIVFRSLPDQIPVHYGIDNQVNRWGSKYEALIFPAFAIITGLIMLRLARFSAKQENGGKNNENICIVSGIFVLILFDAMTGYFLYAALNKVENLSSIALDVNQLFGGLLGITMVVIGNIMPKTRMNSFVGLRTRWSMKNEEVWKKSQRFGGISFVIGGIVIIALCFVAKGVACLLWSVGIVIAIAAVDTHYSYKISKSV